MLTFINVFNTFKDKNCQLLISEENFNKDKHSTKEKYKYIASCGHENQVCLYIFKIRGTGIICPKCVIINNRNKCKEKIKNNPNINLDLEYNTIIFFKELVKNMFDVKFTREGCLADIGLKPNNEENDLWLMIQVKCTTKPGREYSFSCSSRYKNCIILCISYSDKRMWAINGNNITVKHKIAIGLNKSKYSDFEINQNNIFEKLTEYYNIFPKYDFNSINTPVSIYQQLEYEYCKYREEKIKLDFIYNEKNGIVYDFLLNNYKVQEKVGTYIKNRKNNVLFSFHKNNGIEYGIRKLTSYKKDDADFYWLNIPNKKDFYIIPQDELIARKYIDTAIKKNLNIISHQKCKEWLKEYLFDYTNFISKRNLYDSKTFYWQIENAALLKPMGVNMEIIKEVNFLIQKAKDRNNKYYK